MGVGEDAAGGEGLPAHRRSGGRGRVVSVMVEASGRVRSESRPKRHERAGTRAARPGADRALGVASGRCGDRAGRKGEGNGRDNHLKYCAAFISPSLIKSGI